MIVMRQGKLYYRRAMQFFDGQAAWLRVGIALGLLILIWLLWQFLLQQPLENRVLMYDEQVAKLDRDVSVFRVQADYVERYVKSDPSLRQNFQARRGQEEVALLTPDGQVVIVDVLKAGDVLHLFSIKLKQVEGLTLTRLETISSEPLLAEHEELANASEYGQLNKNTVLVEFNANYFSTLRYLNALESSRMRLFWDRFSYEVTSYPMARIALRANFISHLTRTSTAS